MRLAIAALFTLIVASTNGPLRADPYRWCAQYGGKGATNCYFLNLEQCRAATSRKRRLLHAQQLLRWSPGRDAG